MKCKVYGTDLVASLRGTAGPPNQTCSFWPIDWLGHRSSPGGKTVPSKPFNDIYVLIDWVAAWRTPDQQGHVAVPFSCRMAEMLGSVCPATRDVRLNTWIQTAPRELPFGVLCHEAVAVASYQPPSRFA
jgi:hypothetical protein